MKKALIALVCLFITVNALATTETVRIYNNNPNYKMLINYQFCALMYKGAEPSDCVPRVKTTTIHKGQRYIDINIEYWSFYIKVINAYLLDDNNIAKAYGMFPEEDCKAFKNSPVTLEISRDHRINCV